MLSQIKKQQTVSETDSIWLSETARQLNVDQFIVHSSVSYDELLLKLDKIPTALVLAQAANESSWGTSRFAVEANNIFGQYCYSLGCGVVPKNRPSGSKFEVQRFSSINASIASYMRNINRNLAYASLRTMRREMRLHDNLNSIELANGLENYSIRRKEYVKELQAIIRINNLEPGK